MDGRYISLSTAALLFVKEFVRKDEKRRSHLPRVLQRKRRNYDCLKSHYFQQPMVRTQNYCTWIDIPVQTSLKDAIDYPIFYAILLLLLYFKKPLLFPLVYMKLYSQYPYYAYKILSSLISIGYGYVVSAGILFRKVNLTVLMTLIFYNLNLNGFADFEWLLYFACIQDSNPLNILLLAFLN